VPTEILSFIYYNLSNGRYVLAPRISLHLFILKINTCLFGIFHLYDHRVRTIPLV